MLMCHIDLLFSRTCRHVRKCTATCGGMASKLDRTMSGDDCIGSSSLDSQNLFAMWLRKWRRGWVVKSAHTRKYHKRERVAWSLGASCQAPASHRTSQHARSISTCCWAERQLFLVQRLGVEKVPLANCDAYTNKVGSTNCQPQLLFPPYWGPPST